MYSLRIRFAGRRSCLAAMQADMSAIVGRHIRRAVDAQPWAAASNGYTIGRMHDYALEHGLHVAEFTEHKGDYTLRYENAEGARLNALEAAQPKFSGVQNAMSAVIERKGQAPQPTASHIAKAKLGHTGELAMPWDRDDVCEAEPQYNQPEADAQRMRDNNAYGQHTTVVRHSQGVHGNPYHQ